MCRTSSTLLFFVFTLISFVCAQSDFQSPCPRLFVYKAKSKEIGKWYGILTILSNVDTYGVWIRIVFDRPSLQLGNWYGEISTTDNQEYLIANEEDQLKANKPKTIRFYIKYNPSEPPPKLVLFRLNAKTVCPEKNISETSTMSLELKTSNTLHTKPKPPRVEETLNKPTGGFINQKPASSEEEEFYMGDLYHLLNPPSKKNDTGDSNLDEICGTVVHPRAPIAQGKSTNEGEFPWHVALYYAKGIDLTYICGASLISKQIVITAAHCVAKLRSSMPLNRDNLIVYLGKHYLKRFSNQGIQDRQIAEIIIHPEYNAHNYSHDIALLKLAVPVHFTDYVRPVCLWQEPPDLSRIVHKQGNVIGWGFDETGKVSEQLRQAKMAIVSQETCLASFPDFYSRYTSKNTFCAGFSNGTSECNGDSGSGMVLPASNSSPKNPVWQLRGLVSISAALHDKFKCDASHYVVFTDTTKYLDWIKREIK